MRVLIATLGRSDPQAGAARIALLLAAGLRERGHDVVEFGTGVPPAEVPWWRTWRWHQGQLARFVVAQPRFDVVDVPAILAGRALARGAPLVVRSIQPELRYLGIEVWGHLRRVRRSPVLSTASIVHAARIALAVMQAWRRARVLLCLGTAEDEWMARHWPSLKPRLRRYFAAPPPDEQAAFRQIRSQRPRGGSGSRYLWVGRWVDHKGTEALLGFIRDRLAPSGAHITVAGCGDSGDVAVRRELGPDSRIAVLPCFGRLQLRELLAAHDVGLSTSRAEGWGLNLQEMLEAGMTVYSTREGACADLAPFFPETLRPFPPAKTPEPLGRVDEARMPAYYGRFSMPAVAQSYEEALEAALERRG